MRAGTAAALALAALAGWAFGPTSSGTASGPVVEAQKSGDTRAGQPAAPNRAPSPLSQLAFQGLFRPGSSGAPKYRRNTGWTNARYQRAARKRRNQQMNRRAHRG